MINPNRTRLLTIAADVCVGESSSVPVTVLIDSGASKSFISSALVRKHDLSCMRLSTARSVCMANDRVEECVSVVKDARVCMQGFVSSCELYVLPLSSSFDVILGLDWLTDVNPSINWRKRCLTVVTPHKSFSIRVSSTLPTPPLSTTANSTTTERMSKLMSHQQAKRLLRKGYQAMALMPALVLDPEHCNVAALADISDPSLRSVVESYSDVFPQQLPACLPPSRDIEHEIPLVDNAVPPHRPPYRLSPAELDEVRKQLDELLQLGYIQPSTSPFAAPVLLIKKPDGSWRMCIDYRALNKLTVRRRYPLPRIDDLLDRLHKAAFFTKIDLRSGYYQVRISEADRVKTAFVTRYGQFEWLVLPFGLADAPSTFMHVMTSCLAPLLDRCIVVYLDDILVYSMSMKDHVRDVEAVLALLRKHKLYGKLSKCEFGRREVDFLGHVVKQGSISPDPKKVEAMKSWPTPTTQHELRSFIGLATYFRRFIWNFSGIAAPLYSLLTGRQNSFSWTAAHSEAFEALKTALTSDAVLRLPDPSLPFVIACDSCSTAVGGTLLQRDSDGRFHPVAYESHKLSDNEQRWHIHEQELLAVIHCIRVWRVYVYGRPFTVCSDHKALQWLLERPQLSPRQARWLDLFAEYEFTITYKPGESALMRVPDALSRRWLPASTSSSDISAAAESLCAISVSVLQLPAKLKRDFVKGYKKDPAFKSIYKFLCDTSLAVPVRLRYVVSQYRVDDSLLYLQDRLCVPDYRSLRCDILHDAHDAPLAAHRGFDKTYVAVRSSYYWPHLYSYVRRYVLSCDTCQRIKANNSAPAGLLNPLPIPPHAWHSIAMDFMVGLPPSKLSRADSICVVIDRLSKMAHFLPCFTTDSASDIASLFFKNIFRIHGLPATITSDRDPRFISEFWTALFQSMKVSTLR